MGSYTRRGREIFRDYVTDGVPGSGPWQPRKPDIRQWMAEIEGQNSFSISADYPVQQADNGGVIYPGAGANSISFGPIGGYDTNHISWIVVPLGALPQRVNVDGLASYWLYPGQMGLVLRIGGQWFEDHDRRWYTQTSIELYVHHSLGLPINHGLTADSPLPLIQSAIDVIERHIDNGVNGVDIKVLSSAFAEGQIVGTKRMVGNHVYSISGDPATPANCVWTVPAGETGLTMRDWTGAIVRGFRIQAGGSAAVGLSASQFGIVDWDAMEFATFPNGQHVAAVNGGSMNCGPGSSYKIIGGAASHLAAIGGKMLITGNTIDISPGVGMTEYALSTGSGAQITSASNTYTGSIPTCLRHACDLNGVIDSNGADFPGTGAGSTSRGGQFN